MPRDPDALGPRTRPVLIAAAAVLAVVLVLTLGVVLGRDHAPQHGVSASGLSKSPSMVPPMVTASSATTATPVPSSSATTSVAARPTTSPTAEQCPRGLVSDALPAAPPVDETWRATSVAPLPVSPTYGPLRTGPAGLPICFSHSPMGATIAARTIDASLFSTNWRTAIAIQVAHTPGYAELLTALEAAPPDGSADADTLIGFNVVGYTPAVTTIQLVLQGSNGGVAGCSLAVQWTAGDWQLAPRPDGSLTQTPCPTVDPGTYILWGPGQ
jgi:hypothetical protein